MYGNFTSDNGFPANNDNLLYVGVSNGESAIYLYDISVKTDAKVIDILNTGF
jgi:hypothetical protein